MYMEYVIEKVIASETVHPLKERLYEYTLGPLYNN